MENFALLLPSNWNESEWLSPTRRKKVRKWKVDEEESRKEQQKQLETLVKSMDAIPWDPKRLVQLIFAVFHWWNVERHRQRPNEERTVENLFYEKSSTILFFFFASLFRQATLDCITKEIVTEQWVLPFFRKRNNGMNVELHFPFVDLIWILKVFSSSYFNSLASLKGPRKCAKFSHFYFYTRVFTVHSSLWSLSWKCDWIRLMHVEPCFCYGNQNSIQSALLSH